MPSRAGSRPRVEVVRKRLRSHLLDEVVHGGAEATVGGEGDGAKLDVEVLVIDDLGGGDKLAVSFGGLGCSTLC